VSKQKREKRPRHYPAFPGASDEYRENPDMVVNLWARLKPEVIRMEEKPVPRNPFAGEPDRYRLGDE
jgi:hypothetical protein